MQQTGLMQEINMDGFQVVSSDMFLRSNRAAAPAATIWINSLGFNKAAILALNNCERILIKVNTEKRCILISPVNANDRDGVVWSRGSTIPSVRKLGNTSFSKQLYDKWGWDPDYAYRTSGKLVSYEGKLMLLFDFSYAETWKAHKNQEGTAE